MPWLYSNALTNSLFSLGRVAGFSEVNSSGGKRSVQLKLISTARQSSHNVRTMESLNLSPSSAGIFAVSTDRDGGELLTSFLAGFPARTFLSSAKATGSKGVGLDFGERWQESSVKLDLNTFSWKTAHCSEPEDCSVCSKTLPKWGMLVNGVVYRRVIQVPLTKEKESGLWPSSKSRDWKDTGASQGKRKSPDLGTMVHSHELNFPSPVVSDWWAGTRTHKFANPTTVAQYVNKFPAPSEEERNRNSLVCPPASQEAKRQYGKKLNPDWVEWVMNFPIGWTDLSPLKDATYATEDWWKSEPNIPRVTDDKIFREERLAAIGNGQVPTAVRRAWELLSCE